MIAENPPFDDSSDARRVRAGLVNSDETEALGDEYRAAVPSVTIAGYQLIRELHRGGQGVVYEAIQLSTKRKVAVKVLSGGQFAPRSAKKRFKREIELVAQLKHPNIIAIFDSGVTREGVAFYVMEYVRGSRLTQYVQEKRLAIKAMLGLYSTICSAVQYAHRRGIVHRDLKPSNILVDVDGNPKILDFGLAKLLVGPADATVSVTNTVLGTLPYMSPEQTRGNADEVDARVDVYALGIVLYELLTGRFPYPVIGGVAEVLHHVAETPPTPPTRKWSLDSGIVGVAVDGLAAGTCPIDGEVETIVLKALSKERERRYQSAGELGEDVDRYLRGEPIEARRDSMTYVLQKRCRMLAKRHRVTTFLLAVVFGTLFASAIGVPLVFHWTPANMYFERYVTKHASPAVAGPPFESVRLITLDDDTDVVQIAQDEGLEGVTRKNPKSLRRLHGRLMEKLGASGCRVVVWPVIFRKPSNFDGHFVRGVRSLRAYGAEVAVAVPSAYVDEAEFPKLSDIIACSDVRWGTVMWQNNPPKIAFGAKYGRYGPQSALSVTACAAYRHPGMNFEILLDEETEFVELVFHENATRATGATRIARSECIPLTVLNGGVSKAKAVAATGGPTPQLDLRGKDLMGYYEFELPADKDLDSATIAYEEVFSADEKQLRDWFEGKAVVVGDARRVAPRRYIPDGRLVPDVHVQAAALDALLNRVFIRMPRVTGEWLLPLAAAILGCLIGGIGGGRAVRRWLAAMILTVVFILGSMIVYRTTQYLFNPLVPVIALLAAVKLGAIIHRVAVR